MIDETHRADLRSWVDSANDPAGDFPCPPTILAVVAWGLDDLDLREVEVFEPA